MERLYLIQNLNVRPLKRLAWALSVTARFKLYNLRSVVTACNTKRTGFFARIGFALSRPDSPRPIPTRHSRGPASRFSALLGLRLP